MSSPEPAIGLAVVPSAALGALAIQPVCLVRPKIPPRTSTSCSTSCSACSVRLGPPPRRGRTSPRSASTASCAASSAYAVLTAT